MLKILLGIGAPQALAVLVNFARTKVAAVLVGPEGIGVISIIDQTIQFVANLCTLNFSRSTVKFLSKAHSEGGDAFCDGYAVVLKALLVLGTVGALVTTSLVLFRIDLLPAVIAPYKILLLVGLLGIPGMALASFIPNALAAAQYSSGSARLTAPVTLPFA